MTMTPTRLVNGSQIAASATTYYTASDGKTRIDACALTNTTAGAVTVTMYLVPSGGSASASNCILSARSIPAGTTFNVTSAIGQWLDTGGTLQALASSATSVTLVASGVVYTPS